MATTAKGYPYPVGTDRVMDGDDAIKALAEAVDGDALYTRALAVGQGPLTVNTPNNIQWQAAAPNGAALTKTSATVWTVTKAGLYVVTMTGNTTGFANLGTRNYFQLTVGTLVVRASYTPENTATCSLVCACVVGDTISGLIYPNEGTNLANTSWLNVCRLGRT